MELLRNNPESVAFSFEASSVTFMTLEAEGSE